MAKRTKATGVLRHWRVKFMRRGMEPPRPFGKTSAVVCAESRAAAKEAVPASPGYPVTASETADRVTFPYHCHHAAAEVTAAEVAPDRDVTPTTAEIERDVDQIRSQED